MKRLKTPSSPRRLMGLVSCDLFLELIDQSLEGVHLKLAKLRIPASFVLVGLIQSLQPAELLAGVGQLSFASQLH